MYSIFRTTAVCIYDYKNADRGAEGDRGDGLGDDVGGGGGDLAGPHQDGHLEHPQLRSRARGPTFSPPRSLARSIALALSRRALPRSLPFLSLFSLARSLVILSRSPICVLVLVCVRAPSESTIVTYA